MNLDREMVAQFKEYLRTAYGAEPEPDCDFEGEMGRFMLMGSKCLILREHTMRRSADQVEVFLSDKILLGKIDDEFYLSIAGELANLEDPESLPTATSPTPQGFPR